MSEVLTHATPFPFARIGEAARESRVYEFLQDSRFVELAPEVWRLALDVTDGVTDTWQAALALMRFVNGTLKYESFSTNVHTHARDVLRDKRGVCQDFAHVMLSLCRSLKKTCGIRSLSRLESLNLKTRCQKVKFCRA